MDCERTRSAKARNVSSGALLALLALLVIDLAEDRLPVQAEVLIGLVAVLSTVVVVGLLRARVYRYAALFLVLLLLHLNDRLSLPAWVDVFLVAAAIIVLPWLVWGAVKEYRR